MNRDRTIPLRCSQAELKRFDSFRQGARFLRALWPDQDLSSQLVTRTDVLRRLIELGQAEMYRRVIPQRKETQK